MSEKEEELNEMPLLATKTNKKRNIQITKNAFNLFYYDYFNKLANGFQSLAYRRGDNNRGDKIKTSVALIYKKIASSIKKYPFPIVSIEQASSLEGVGDRTMQQFIRAIEEYKDYLSTNSTDYINLAYKIKGNKESKKKANYINMSNMKLCQKSSSGKKATFSVSKRSKLSDGSNKINISSKQLRENKAEAKMLNIKRSLFNVGFGSSLWTCLISIYLCFLDNNNSSIKLQDVEKYSKLLKKQLKTINIKIKDIETDDFTELKNRRFLDDLKSTKLKVNDDLCRLAKLELTKLNIDVKKVIYEDDLVFKIKENSPNKTVIPGDEEIEKFIKNESEDLLEKYKKFTNSKLNKNEGLFPENVVMLIDIREKGQNNENIKNEIINKLHTPINIEEKQLSIGDYTWAYNDPLDNKMYMIDFLIERKTLNDLASSIIDGRYNEQKYRIKKSGYKNAYYLFEGTEINTKEYFGRSNLNKEALNNAIYNTVNIHNFCIIRTPGTKETINKLIELDQKIKKGFEFLMVDNKKVTLEEYNENYVKTKNSTIKETFYRQLRCLYNCGNKTVEILGKYFKTPYSLYKFISDLRKKDVEIGKMDDFENILEKLDEENNEINADNYIKMIPKIKENELQKTNKSNSKSNSKRDRSEEKGKGNRKLTNNFIVNFLAFYGFKDNDIIENNEENEEYNEMVDE